MQFSMLQTKYLRSTGRKVVVAIAFASLISGLSISSAFADRNDNQDRGDWHGDHGQRGHHEGHGQRNEHQRHYSYEQRSYERPVYVPPPVYYEPRQSFSVFS
jgi:ABC-type Zn2+ transport system substrate-binding protein/surface adhesin